MGESERGKRWVDVIDCTPPQPPTINRSALERFKIYQQHNNIMTDLTELAACHSLFVAIM